MTPTLRFAFDEVYRVFARYEDTLNCVRNSGINRPLHLLTREDWSHVNQEFDMPVLLWDSTRFCHFLPRLLEWCYEDRRLISRIGYWDFSDLGYRLERFGWSRWPSEEVEALRQVLGIWTAEALLNREDNAPIQLLLDVTDDLKPYFNPWMEARPLEAALWITQQDWIHPQPVVLQWVVQPLVEEQLEKAFWEHPEGEHAALFSRSIQLVQSLRELQT